MRGLAGKRVLVTGGARGIGLAAAERFVEEGALVAIADLEPQSHRSMVTIRADMADPQAVDAMVETAAARLGGLDVLVANAGIKHPSPAHSLSLDAFDSVLAVNLRGAFWSMRAALRRFLDTRTKGAMVAVTSIHEALPLQDDTSYAIAKAGLSGAVRNLALNYARDGIRVNAVGPGGVMTAMNPSWARGSKALDSFEARVPMGRAADPAEIAAAICFLASDDASYVTGQTLFVDGGLLLL